MTNENLASLQKQAAHCRQLADLFLDQRVARELLTIAAKLDAEVEKRERETTEYQDHAA